MSTVEDIQTDTTTAIGTYRDDLVAKLTALATFRPAIYTATSQPLPPLDSIDGIKAGSFKSLERTTVPTASLVVKTSIPTPVKIKSSSVVLTEPQPYTPLSGESAPQYTSPVLDETSPSFTVPAEFTRLAEKIQTMIETGGDNISPTVQTAVFEQGYERDKQTFQDALDLTGAKTGAKGARYANSMTKALQKEVTTAYINQKFDMSRKIIEVMANFAQENIKAAMSTGASVASSIASIFNQSMQILNDMKRLSLEKYKSDIMANAQIFEGLLKRQLLDLGVQKDNQDLQRGFVSAQREQLALESKKNIDEADATNRTELLRAETDSRTNLLTAEVDNRMKALGFGQSLQANTAEFEAVNKLVTLQVEVDKLIQHLKIEKNEQIIRAFGAFVQQTEATQRINLSDIQGQNTIVAGMLEHVANGYSEIMKSLGMQGVTIKTVKTTA
jgi:hypothetical protein